MAFSVKKKAWLPSVVGEGNKTIYKLLIFVFRKRA